MSIAFIEDLKEQTLNRKLKVAELANQNSQLVGAKARKTNTINTLKEKYNQTFDASLFVEITELEDEVRAIESQLKQIECVLNGKAVKVKTSHNIEVELEDKIDELGMKDKTEKIKENVEQLARSINDYFVAHEEIRGLVNEVAGMSDEVDINDLNTVLHWFNHNKEKYSFSGADYKECQEKNIGGNMQKAYELVFSMDTCASYLYREILRIQKEGK